MKHLILKELSNSSKHLLCHMIVRLWDSTCQFACQRPTSWSDMMWLRSQGTTQATYIHSNQGIFQEAHVTLCPNSHTDMLSWIPDIPWPVSSSQQQATMSAYLKITPCASPEGGLKNTEGGHEVHLSAAARVTVRDRCVCPCLLLSFTSVNSTVDMLVITPLQSWM